MSLGQLLINYIKKALTSLSWEIYKIIRKINYFIICP